jgi:hypothetical protein
MIAPPGMECHMDTEVSTLSDTELDLTGIPKMITLLLRAATRT